MWTRDKQWEIANSLGLFLCICVPVCVYLSELLVFQRNFSVITYLPQSCAKSPLICCYAQVSRILHTLRSDPRNPVHTLWKAQACTVCYINILLQLGLMIKEVVTLAIGISLENKCNKGWNWKTGNKKKKSTIIGTAAVTITNNAGFTRFVNALLLYSLMSFLSVGY